MAVPYYFGQQAIAERLGYKSAHTIRRLILKQGFPAYRRVERNRHGRGAHRAWCISESAITAWELSKGAESVREYRREVEERKRVRQERAA